jgi:hypothetical protein
MTLRARKQNDRMAPLGNSAPIAAGRQRRMSVTSRSIAV